MPKERDALTEPIQAFVAARVQPKGPMAQKELAELSGQRIDRIHKFVKGDLAFPPMAFLDAILRVLGTNLCEQIQGIPVKATPPPPALSASERVLLRAYGALLPPERKLVLTLARKLQGQRRRQAR